MPELGERVGMCVDHACNFIQTPQGPECEWEWMQAFNAWMEALFKAPAPQGGEDAKRGA